MTSYAWFVRGAHHAAMCRTSIESVRRADPSARIILVTDEDPRSWNIEAMHLSIAPGQPIMLANIEAQIAALWAAASQRDEQIVFLDTDTLMVRPFMNTSADVDFTWRDSIGLDDDGEKVEGIASRMPYNYGVISAYPGLAALEVFIWIRERIRVMHDSHQKWYGNQLAVAELAGARPAAGTATEARRIPWRLTLPGRTVSIGKVPCETHNYTPQAADEDVSEKFVLHFKGRKRALMEVYAKRLGVGWYAEKAAA